MRKIRMIVAAAASALAAAQAHAAEEMECRSAPAEGATLMRSKLWRFRSGNVDYVVSEPGCGPDTLQGARAKLQVLIGGQSRLRSWCF